MELSLKGSRPRVMLSAEDRQYFQHFCNNPSQIHETDIYGHYSHDQFSGKANSPAAEPWWHRWNALPENTSTWSECVQGIGSASQQAASAGRAPATAYPDAGSSSPGDRRMRFDAMQMQKAAIDDLLEAKKSCDGHADTPASLLLSMLSDLLLGHEPDLDDVQLARSLLLRHTDPYQPLNLRHQMKEANLDSDVVSALMHQLGASSSSSSSSSSFATATTHGSRCAQNATAPKPDDAIGSSEDQHHPKAAGADAAGDSILGPTVDQEEDVEELTPDNVRDVLAMLMRPPTAPAAPGRFFGASRSDSGAGGGSSGCGSEYGQQLHTRHPWVPAPLMEEVERELANAEAWQYDTWRLAELTQGHALSCLGFYLLHREGLISQFRIQPTKLARLLRVLESGYPPNSYHTSTHAADVLQTLHVLLRGAGLTTHYLDRLGLMAAYFAAIIHDHGHPGLTADFLIATSNPLAVRYNDRSPLENHHGASFFALLQQRGMNAMEQLSAAERAAFRKQVLDLVMATDMKQHFSLLAHFNTAHRLAAYNKDIGPWTLARSSTKPLHRSRSGTESVAVPDGGTGPEVVCPAENPRPLDDTERVLTLQIALKAADLGHLGEELVVHKRWVHCLEEEFFLQGDKEQQLGLPVSPLFDRAKQGVSKSQVGFYDFIALPLVHSLASAFPGAKPLLACFVDNYDHWREVDRAAAAAVAVAACPTQQQTPQQ